MTSSPYGTYDDQLATSQALFQRCSFFDQRTNTWSRDNYWKGPLRAVVERDEVDAMSQAITDHVGGVPTKKILDNGMILLECRGYYHYVGA